MKSIEVLLRDKVENLGHCGDVVKVAAGYARNYLLPKRLAITATAENKKMMARRRSRIDLEIAARSAEVQKRVDALAGVKIETTVKADDHGRLYGSVNASAIAELVTAKGFAIVDKDVRLENGPIKTVGEHRVPIHVQDDRYAEVMLTVHHENPPPVKAPVESDVVAEDED